LIIKTTWWARGNGRWHMVMLEASSSIFLDKIADNTSFEYETLEARMQQALDCE
jgi:hypothetical protein